MLLSLREIHVPLLTRTQFFFPSIDYFQSGIRKLVPALDWISELKEDEAVNNIINAVSTETLTHELEIKFRRELNAHYMYFYFKYVSARGKKLTVFIY